MNKSIRSQIRLLLKLPLPELIAYANQIRVKAEIFSVELCNIMNAKSGVCAENCKFCAQSGRHETGISSYPLKSRKEMLKQAFLAKKIGAHRFDIVTSGNRLNEEELKQIAAAIFEIRKKVGIAMCASLGELSEKELQLLKAAGLSRYHHNIETSPRYFPKVVTTHTFDDRIKTIKAAKKAGLQVCSGGIIGMGETLQDRIDMALILKELDVDSVPINIFVPIKGTVFGNKEPLSCFEAIQAIALFRIILKDKIIKLAAGRESILKDFQALGFMAGANGMLIGGYLTIKGRDVEADKGLAKEVIRLWKT